MLNSAYIFRTQTEAIGLFDRFLGGFYLVKGLPLIFQLVLWFSFGFAVFFAAYNSKNKSSSKLSELFSWVCFVSMVFLLFQPWDELFVNLMHSKHLAENGSYSFSKYKKIEGSVDFLIYYLIGIMSRWSDPLCLSFFQGLLGGIAALLVLRKIVLKISNKLKGDWVLLLLCFYAPLSLNSAIGFTATAFSALIFWGFYFVFYTSKFALGLGVLSLVPLARIEGLWLVLLLVSLYAYENKKELNAKTASLLLTIPFLPALMLCIWRHVEFGYVFPLPIHYKATSGNLFYLLMGMRNLLTDMVSSLSAVFILLGLVAIKLLNIKKQGFLIRAALCFFAFVFPYYLSGGDWFPTSWGRYLLPFSLFSLMFFISVLSKVIESVDSKIKIQYSFVAFLLFLINLLAPFGSYSRWVESVFHQKRTLADLTLKRTGRNNYRIHYLSQVGFHFGQTTEAQDVIASSEMATVMYYADREALDFLGITNPNIISQPIRQTPGLLRKSPRENELPFLIFKRLNPSILARTNPPFLYTFDFIPQDLFENTPFEEMTDAFYLRALNRWDRGFTGLVGPLYGGTETILKLGYLPFIVQYRNYFATMYFVAKEAKDHHLETLKQKGFVGGEVRF